jgi:glucoamylase
VGWGRGRAWPLLTAERAHYELAAGRDVKRYLKAIESFANSTGLLPEQIWDAEDVPSRRMFFGRPTGSAMPLMWAHAEYIKLLRSVRDGVVFDRIAPVADRYAHRHDGSDREIWKFNRQIVGIKRCQVLRIQAHAAFRLRFSTDGWQSKSDRYSTDTAIGVHYCDISPEEVRDAPVQFTFFWTDSQRWEGRDFRVEYSSQEV